MKRLLLLIILIIILVSLNWFSKVMAQDLSQLSQRDKELLLKKYQGAMNSKPASSSATRYETPPLYDSTSTVRVPEETSATSDSTQSTSPSATAGRTRPTKFPDFEDLRPFGLELFNGPRETAPPEDIASSGDYVLGPGDNILVSLWGRVEGEYDLTVDREGKVFIPKVGELAVWGKTVDDFRTYVRNRLSQVYSEFQVNVSLGKIRAIRIYLTGEVNRPGAYTVSSLTSLFNALYLAGGPNENGSFRDIRLMRGGKVIAALDLYKFLMEGDNSSDVRLESGDAVFVPVAGSRVAIRGEIRRPAIYELRQNETALELIRLAGNALPQAHLDRVLLERVAPQGEWEVRDLNLNKNGAQPVTDVTLGDGDRLTVYSIFNFKKNMVMISGQVKHPGYYERANSSQVLDLILRAELQDYDVYFDRADLFRRYPDRRVEVIPIDLKAVISGDTVKNICLSDRDSLHIYRIQDVEREQKVYIGGEVDRPGEYDLYDKMTVADLIFLAGSYTRQASRLQGEVARVDSLGEVTLRYINLLDSAALMTALQEDDRVYIRTIPEWEKHRTVKIDGEVMYPGEYVMSTRHETLYGLLTRAGGFTQTAFAQGAVFERGSIGRKLDQMQVTKIMRNSAPLYEDSTGRLHTELVVNYDSMQVNRIIIDISRLVATGGRTGDLELQPGDHIYIPPVPSGISVIGAVGATGTIKFCEGKDAHYYIKQAGDFTPRSDKKGTRLIKANGAVYSGRGVLGRRVEVGDVVVVPARIEKDRDWLRTMSTAFAATTSVLTTVLLINKL